jgi:catechol 2,3-dioxygenase-like lactoylglutathione lyase family enzyme
MKLEVIVVPVADVDRAKQFYSSLGWRLDADFVTGETFRVIQFTPPGSDCSVIFGRNVTSAAPGTAQGLYLIVADVAAARDELFRRGVAVSELFHPSSDRAGNDEPFLLGSGRISGRDPEGGSYQTYASFRDPDGNGWFFQEVTKRLPGRVDAPATVFASEKDLADAMRRAEAAHGRYEATLGKRDEDWPQWYARYMAAEQAGTELPS